MISSSELRAARAVIAKANKERRKARPRPPKIKADRGRIRDNAHLAFIRRLPCVATFIKTGQLVYGCEAAHLRMSSARHGKPLTGKSVKPDDKWVTPLSHDEHWMQGNMIGEGRFWSDLGVDPFELCLALYAASGDDAAGLAIIQSLRSKS